MVNFAGHSVVNLSNVTLTKDQTDVLSRGLTFCPSPPKTEMVDIVQSLDKVLRTMRYRAFFEKRKFADKLMHKPLPPSKPQYPINLKPYKAKGTDPGPVGCDEIETFKKLVFNDLLRSKVKFPGLDNLSMPLRQALRDLSSNTDIVIKKADKGSAVVVMNTTDYITEARRQLDDLVTYKTLQSDPSESITTQIREVLNMYSLGGHINPNDVPLLLNEEAKPGRFYMLPKIHKKGVPGRPICGSNGCATESISAFVDEHIKSYATSNPSYLRDTGDFINKIRKIQNLPKDAILCTLDVTSLYTNIPHKDGLEALKTRLEGDPQRRAPTKLILKLAQLVLENNVIEFDEQLFLQLMGTAMGTKMAPNYANIFMGEFEKQAIANYHLKPLVWLRFIDDVFMIWTHGQEELDKFVQYLNQIKPSIKFTCEQSLTQVCFLDTWVVRDVDNTLYTKVYSKPTDTFDYLKYESSHPSHCKSAGPKAQLLRVRRNSTKDVDFLKTALTTIAHYHRRGYPSSVTTKALLEVKKLSQADCLQPKPKDKVVDKLGLFLILPFNETNPNLKHLFSKHWHILHSTALGQNLFPKTPLRGYSRTQNLREVLTSSKLKTKPKSSLPDQSVAHKCYTYNCKVCKLLHNTGGYIRSYVSRESFKIVAGTCCMTPNVIYCLSCTKCKVHYVGETKRLLNIRFKEHLGDIINRRNKPVPNHFLLPGHQCKHLALNILEVIKGDPTLDKTSKYRRMREKVWIYRLRSPLPFGLNAMV